MRKAYATLKDHVLAKVRVDESSGCWLWTGRLSGQGYGHVSHRRKNHAAHRASYEAHIGPIPKGLEIDHRCRVRHCVNPAHLEAVTHAENVRRGDLRFVQGGKPACPRGHAYDEANTIRRPNGSRGCRACINARQLAKRFGPDRQRILEIEARAREKRRKDPAIQEHMRAWYERRRAAKRASK